MSNLPDSIARPVSLLVLSIACGLGAIVAGGAGPSQRAADPAELAPQRAAVPAVPNAMAMADVEGGFASTHIFVRVREGVTFSRDARGTLTFAKAGRIDATARSVRTLLSNAKAASAAPFFRDVANRALAQQLGMDRVYRIELPAGSDTPALVNALAKATTIFDRVELDGVGGLASELPNDPEFVNQYAFHNTGQSILGVVGLDDADSDLPEAWELAAARGLDTSTVAIAVLDSGVNNHTQLSGRLLPGWNIPDNTAITIDECSSHGTHVSGILAGSGNDGVGTTGIAWQAKIAPYVVVNPCTGFESSVATALTMATDAGYRLVNMSLQFYAGTNTLRDAVLYAYAQDVIMVAAAGNNNNSNIAYPGRWPETICVSSTTNTNAKSSFSNFGPEVDLCAGGTSIRSLIGTSAYGYKDGTSQATPMLTGTIALMLAWNPSLTPDQVRQILIDTAVDLGPAGFDNNFGYGRLNAYAALLATPALEPADLDHDGQVGASDLAIMLGAWGGCVDCDGTCIADLDGNCAVDATDIALLLGAWGPVGS